MTRRKSRTVGSPRCAIARLTRGAWILVCLLTAAAGGSGAGASEAAVSARPPAGLTEKGRTLWQLEALLHDTFGDKEVWLQYSDVGRPRNFSTQTTALCCGGSYGYTFRTARGSRFRLLRPNRPPVPNLGASGGEVPLKANGAYIYCGSGLWLYEHVGNGPAIWHISCHR